MDKTRSTAGEPDSEADRYARLKSIFLAACDLTPEARQSLLGHACGGDTNLRVEVEALLAEHDAAQVRPAADSQQPTDGVLEVGSGGGFRHVSSPGERPGDYIGPYKLLSILGEGGFGVVWLAEQAEPIRRRVALKIIKLGMDTKQVIARFEQERQALAVMDHPNVAKVLDAGATPLGRPYFVMEHVPGEPITDYCDRHTLTVKQRLELFIPVCEAVQHAHYNGIIHRDISPSNILVTIMDDKAIPKVIDFGVAKAISHIFTEKTIFTELGQIIGKPEYMSPEQAEMSRLDVDTRTDVYSLGVLLYELLTGALPFDSEYLRSKAYHEIQRIIREDPTPKPSTKLTGLGDKALGIATRREAQRTELINQLRKELEWIPLMAMRKDRMERYDTPKDLARDIRNYLSGRPLDARLPSAAYILRKFVIRNKKPLLVGGAVALTMLGGIKATLWGLQEARNARAAEQAEAAARDAAQSWLGIESEIPGCRALSQRVDPESLELNPQATSLGTVPIHHLLLEPGHYRITILAPTPDTFAEFNAILVTPGPAHETLLLVRDMSSFTSQPVTASASAPPRILSAFLPARAGAEDMALIPAGDYVFGWSEDDDPDPVIRRRTVRLPAFWIERTEVSNREYKQFIDATGHPVPSPWEDTPYDPAYSDRPVVGIALEDAEAFARWRGRRLPSMLEWQAAARGPDGRRYPWGDALDAADAAELPADPTAEDLIAEQSWSRLELFDRYRRNSVAVNLPEARPPAAAILHLFDNVREITGSVDLLQQDAAVAGRCWIDAPRYNDLSRVWTTPLASWDFKHGFRCAKSAAAPDTGQPHLPSDPATQPRR